MNGPDSRSHGSSSLLCVYYPQQLLPGLAAVLSFRRQRGEGAHAPLAVFVWSPPALSDEARDRRMDAFKLLLGSFPWATLHFPGRHEVRSHLSDRRPVMAKAAYLKGRFGPSAFDAIYYAHDLTPDFIAQAAMQAFPGARRICFGDAFGVVYSNDYFTRITYPLGFGVQGWSHPLQTLRNMRVRLKRTWALPPIGRRLEAEYAALILPCDPGADFLAGKTLLAVDLETTCEVLKALAGSVEGHEVPAQAIAGEPGTLMLLGSYSESRLTSEAQECALYVEVARTHVAAGSHLTLKPHPASHPEKIERIQRALSSRYAVSTSAQPDIPVEVMPWLAKQPQILSFSYATVSLQYLYGTTVRHVLNDDLIDRFFPIETREWLRDGNNLYLQQEAIARQTRNQGVGA